MQGSGVDAQEFVDGLSFREAVGLRTPDIVFIDVPLEAGEAIASISALAHKEFRGAVQLMSTRGGAVLENMKSIGEQHNLTMLPVLKKPFDSASIVRVIHELKIGIPPTVAARIDLEDAINNNWLEFWYQPKIDLRRKQLAGAEAFARARHPEFGVLPPGAFMPGAGEPVVQKLSELVLARAIQTQSKFSELGVHLRIAVNIPAAALRKIRIDEIVRSQKGNSLDNWPGLLIDLPEEQAIGEIDLIRDLSATLSPLKVNFAIDNFGRGHSTLMRQVDIPFVEVKLDQSLVIDCSTDKAKAPTCKTVIDLAHNFRSTVVAVGLEKAADLVAMVSMGCDYGQGFLLGQPMPEERFLALLRQRANTPRPAASAIPVKKAS